MTRLFDANVSYVGKVQRSCSNRFCDHCELYIPAGTTYLLFTAQEGITYTNRICNVCTAMFPEQTSLILSRVTAEGELNDYQLSTTRSLPDL